MLSGAVSVHLFTPLGIDPNNDGGGLFMAAVALAGVYAGARASSVSFKDMRLMFLGAGSAATGIGDLVVAALEAEGLSREDARARLWFVDRDGLIQSRGNDLMLHNAPYAHTLEPMSFLTALDAHKPHALIGATGAPGTFTQQVVEPRGIEPLTSAVRSRWGKPKPLKNMDSNGA